MELARLGRALAGGHLPTIAKAVFGHDGIPLTVSVPCCEDEMVVHACSWVMGITQFVLVAIIIPSADCREHFEHGWYV